MLAVQSATESLLHSNHVRISKQPSSSFWVQVFVQRLLLLVTTAAIIQRVFFLDVVHLHMMGQLQIFVQHATGRLRVFT